MDLKSSQTVKGDKNRIGQVITNFLTNAIKYAPATQKIEAGSRTDGDNVIFSVRDFGIGLEQKDVDKIFERFYRVNSNEANFRSGLGLGLYISAEIIRRHNGRIWVESEKGKGATFHFSLPVQG